MSIIRGYTVVSGLIENGAELPITICYKNGGADPGSRRFYEMEIETATDADGNFSATIPGDYIKGIFVVAEGTTLDGRKFEVPAAKDFFLGVFKTV
jgi:hypothetical protein